MKTIILILSLLASYAVSSDVITLKAKWNANSESDLAGYFVEYGVVASSHPNHLEANMDTTIQLTNWPADKPCYIVAKAYDRSGNISLPSVEAVWFPDDTPPPPPPPPELVGDFNGDLSVTLSDNVLYWFILGIDSSDPRWAVRQTYDDVDTQFPSYCEILASEMDLDGNGVVTMGDKVIHESYWGNTIK